MRMIPTQPIGTNGSKAEQRVFDQLRAAFSGADKNGWFAMHSLRLPRHAYKRFGEIDFVVCGPEGFFVLEIKGGGVACRQGVWETTNRYGETHRLKESPFAQAETALHGLREKLPAPLSHSFVVGYGVIFPDVDRVQESSEWDRAVLADARDFRQFEKWLERFIKHWRMKGPSKPIASSEQLNALQQHLRPDFEAVESLHTAVNEVENRIARLTEEQLSFIDVVEANSRVICSGGAGTGKTMLGLELAKRWAASGLKVGLVCYSPWLKGYLERNTIPDLTIGLVDSIQVTARRNGIDKFDALVVDEGQDVLNLDSLDLLDSHLHGGLTEGRWCFFHDCNNQSGLCGFYEPDAYDYLESLSPVKVPLTKNCRNSLPILRKIQNELMADLGNPGVGDGPSVREINISDKRNSTEALEEELQALVNDVGFNLGEIVVLSQFPFAQSCAAELSKDTLKMLSVLDDASPRNSARTTIGFAEIGDYKGLESEVIVLVDLPRPESNETLRSMHYVGMSRARSLLSVIYS